MLFASLLAVIIVLDEISSLTNRIHLLSDLVFYSIGTAAISSPFLIALRILGKGAHSFTYSRILRQGLFAKFLFFPILLTSFGTIITIPFLFSTPGTIDHIATTSPYYVIIVKLWSVLWIIFITFLTYAYTALSLCIMEDVSDLLQQNLEHFSSLII